MPIALSILLPFAELAGIAIGTVSTAVGVTALSNKVEDYIEDNPEQAEKIFAMIMPEQGLAALFNKEADSGDEEVSDEEVTESESGSTKDIVLEGVRRAREGKGNYSSPDATGPAVSGQGNVIRGLKEAGKIRQDNDPNYDASKKYQGYKKWTKKADGGIMTYAHGGNISDAPVNKVVDGQDHQLSYITSGEANTLVNQGGIPTMTDSGIMAYPPGMHDGMSSPSSNTGNTGNVGNTGNENNNISKGMNIHGPKKGPTFSSDGSGDKFAPDDPTLAEKIDYTGDTVFGPQQKYSGDGIFSGYRNLDEKGQPLMGMDFVKDKFKGFNPLGLMLGLINPALGLAYRGFNFMKDKVPQTLDTFKDSDTLVEFFNNMKETPKVESIVNTGPKARDAFTKETIQPGTFDVSKVKAMINNAKENPDEFANGGQVGIGSMFVRKR